MRQRKERRIGLVLADGHPIVLRGLRHLFQRDGDIDILACCTNADQTLRAVERHRPAMLVLDLRLPPRGGLALLREIVGREMQLRVVLLTASITPDEMAEALRLGVRGVVLKEMAPALLVKCIRKVSQGSVWLESASALDAVEQMLRRRASLEEMRHTLTPREVQILQLVARGLRNRDIAARFNIAEGTVKIHVHNIYTKLGLKDRLELVLCAREKALA